MARTAPRPDKPHRFSPYTFVLDILNSATFEALEETDAK